MKNIPTAEEFMLDTLESMDQQEVERAMIEFAKMHVEAALKAADEQARVTTVDHEEISEGSFRPVWGVDSDSILKAYSLDNIQ